jgi:ParB-like chromosome segregation protein Spo0J
MVDMVSVNEVVVDGKSRKVDEAKVAELAGSIKEIGLIQPITIGPDNKLIAGQHRLAAFKQLGLTEIPCIRVTADTLVMELMTIDENLVRSELHYIERGDQLKRRKEIYEALHPETKKGVSGAVASNESQHHGTTTVPGTAAVSFAKDTEGKTGMDERTIRRDIQIASNLSPKAKEAVIQHDVSRNDAAKLAAISAKEPEKADKIIDAIVEEDLTFDQAKSKVAAETIQARIVVDEDDGKGHIVYTIGTNGKTLPEFLQILIDNKIDIVVDVRESTKSFYKQDFEGEFFSGAVSSKKMTYYGYKDLGVPYVVRAPYIDGFIDTKAFSDWYTWNVQVGARDAYDALLSVVGDNKRVVLVCAEKYALPQGEQKHTCHRALLAKHIAKDLAKVVTEVIHL